MDSHGIQQEVDTFTDLKLKASLNVYLQFKWNLCPVIMINMNEVNQQSY